VTVASHAEISMQV